MKMNVRNLFAGVGIAFVILLATGIGQAAVVSYSGGTYSQNFNTLITSGTGQPWANDTVTPTLQGWNLYTTAGADVTTYSAGAGTSATGSFYSFGTGTSTERALGGVGSGSFSGYIALAIQNTTGGSLGEFTVSFNGEQWRNGGNASLAQQTMVLEYGFGATFATVSSWTAPGGNFNWASPVTAATAASVDGNAAGLVSSRGGTITGLNWTDTQTLWIRWAEINDTGNDHGLAIDDFTITAVPEPTNIALGIFASGLLAFSGARAWGKKLKH
jgi:hypothetical protein